MRLLIIIIIVAATLGLIVFYNQVTARLNTDVRDKTVSNWKKLEFGHSEEEVQQLLGMPYDRTTYTTTISHPISPETIQPGSTLDLEKLDQRYQQALNDTMKTVGVRYFYSRPKSERKDFINYELRFKMDRLTEIYKGRTD